VSSYCQFWCTGADQAAPHGWAMEVIAIRRLPVQSVNFGHTVKEAAECCNGPNSSTTGNGIGRRVRARLPGRIPDRAEGLYRGWRRAGSSTGGDCQARLCAGTRGQSRDRGTAQYSRQIHSHPFRRRHRARSKRSGVAAAGIRAFGERTPHRTRCLFGYQCSMRDDHSPLEPRFPISNRTVKRRRANDSADYLCESRSSSGTYKAKRPTLCGSFCIGATCRAAALHESALTGLIVRRRRSGWDVQMRPNALALGLLALQASAVNTLGEGTCRLAMMGHLQAGGLRATVSIQ
jgi:hypothetical protein